jgi:hypothetical protein
VFRDMRAPRSLLALAGVAGLLLTFSAAAPAAPAHHGTPRQRIAIPAYWGPDTTQGAAMFARLAQNGPTNDIVVVNGSQSKPESPFNPAWARSIAKMHAAGIRVLTYVDTGYYGVTFPPYSPRDTRPDGPGGGSHSTAAWTAQIEADIDGWYALYGSDGVDGIFLDETTEPCGTDSDPRAYVNLYAGIRHHIAVHHPGAYVIINPGVPVDRCYEPVADTILTFEGTYTDYVNGGYGPPKAWQLNSRNPDKFWNLIYDVPDAPSMQAVIAQSKRQNVGYVFVTDDQLTFDDSGTVTNFPWDTIPSYWERELVAAAGVRDHRPPSRPRGLTAMTHPGASSIQVDLRWNVARDDVAVSHYEVFENGRWIGPVYDNALIVNGLRPRTRYAFAVRAVDAAGNVSRPSRRLIVTTPDVVLPDR